MANPVIYKDNPFNVLINDSHDDPTQIQARYETHRVNRNAQQREKILADDFPGWTLDTILQRLDGPAKEEGFVDPRNCLVFWARPPPHIRQVVAFVQNELKAVAPSLWLMPQPNLHTTVLEVAHSLTEPEIARLVQTLKSSEKVTQQTISDYPLTHQSRLLRPMVSFDASALALSFAPAAEENQTQSHGESSAEPLDPRYTYHHLRRDVFDLVRQTGLPVASRYIAPSAHVTIARFINQEGFEVQGQDGAKKVDSERVQMLMERIESVNATLRSKYWPREDGSCAREGEWIVGQEGGLVVRRGRLWYGDGEDV
ncbi:RNA ligase/cyclic nucleotide phosphodiesterase [Penicillium diatomitis]|uniref:RNA ligase/cyclic nucleotide phosphodiesterase n=1 Tax=Penicillium diatomitis TaxID=2819901 RepID=A0A9X0BY86_9EURO|nr:RNA ligase/cyclic nucleotide phosphodiesterase [Penicillium diatomitis]KAJ5489611.1 RNA ligase/cyclic nucleotide phosphodiesterase [Penicillium diatomitis]